VISFIQRTGTSLLEISHSDRVVNRGEDRGELLYVTELVSYVVRLDLGKREIRLDLSVSGNR